MIVGEERKRKLGKLFTNVLVEKAELGNAIFVFEDGDIIVEIANLG